MNPQLNKVFSKLAKEDKKTELKSEKVELASISDLKKATAAVEKGGIPKFDKAEATYFKSLRNWIDVTKELGKERDQLQTQVDMFKKAAKDLGLDADSVEEYKKATRTILIAANNETEAGYYFK